MVRAIGLVCLPNPVLQRGASEMHFVAKPRRTDAIVGATTGSLRRPKVTALIKGLFIACCGPVAWAQDSQPDAAPSRGATELERVTVTGSNLRRTDSETPSPVQVITAQELKSSGYTHVQDVLHNLTANGQGTLSQNFSGAFAIGAAGVSLRGLMVGATLVLIDGHRMAPFPNADDNIRSFVDIANIPLDAIERIEVLKDGASAIYGSDAVAGVVNIILRRSFVGATITADLGTSYRNDGLTRRAAGMIGFGDLGRDGHNFYVAAELRKQHRIRLADRGGSFTQTDFTANGGYDLTPGAPASRNPLVGGHPASATGYVTDPSGAIVGFMPGCDAASLAAARCTYHDQWRQIQPATENHNLVGRFTQSLGAHWQLSLQASYFESRAQQVSGPSRSFPNGFQGITSGPGVSPTLKEPPLPPTTIPNTNPSFPAGTGLTSGVLYYNFLDLGPRTTATDARSSRWIASIEGRLAAWDLAASAGYTQVLLDLTSRNVVDPSNLQAALNSATDPYLVGRPNNAAVANFIAPTLASRPTSKLSFIHLAAGRDVMALPGGPLALALGADLVRWSLDSRQPSSVEAGRVPFGNAFAVGRQNVDSLYGELAAPITGLIEVDAAVRYDHYNLSGGKASPKFGIKYKPVPELALRATVSRGFRAPGPAENGTAGGVGGANVNDPILCPDPANPSAPGSFPTQCGRGLALLLGSNPALKPETSTAFTLGLIVEPSKGLSATLDFYSIKISNQIGIGSSPTLVRGTNFTPIEQVQPDGSTILVVPPVAPIAYMQFAYINGNSTRTSGVDLGVQFRGRIEDFGSFKSDLTVSYVAKYDLTVDGVTYHLAGTHGPFVVSGDTGNPRTRAQWANTFERGPWQVTGTLNYVGSYGVTDPSAGMATCLDALAHGGGAASLPYQGVLASGVIPNGVGCRVKSFTTFDAYLRYQVSRQFSVHASVVNLFNASAPEDWATYGGAEGAVPWNPSFHAQGAVGRFFRIGATYDF
jgi:iron complex outermembrane receptor protein